MSDVEIEDIDEMLRSEQGAEQKPDLEILKELFKQKEIESKTELTSQQVVLVNQKRTIANLLGWDILNEALSDYMLLQVSKDRKGRGEFISGFTAEREDTRQQSRGGFFGGIKDRFMR